jgi:hypothetical protein
MPRINVTVGRLRHNNVLDFAEKRRKGGVCSVSLAKVQWFRFPAEGGVRLDKNVPYTAAKTGKVVQAEQEHAPFAVVKKPVVQPSTDVSPGISWAGNPACAREEKGCQQCPDMGMQSDSPARAHRSNRRSP